MKTKTVKLPSWNKISEVEIPEGFTLSIQPRFVGGQDSTTKYDLTMRLVLTNSEEILPTENKILK